ncbi:XRE family transcriptional regulator [Saccharophagus degradans]|uniref:Transcriptional regulator, XRE family n=1 Tax=Saccharophagus degradans (strain 2-40 / ATCC 43961 / DSM 17024) TaxID=203122 RepID=Q21MR9_SACD2|nr:XRE family transcriptional regulator [Saccharophagus degradans]ABD80010.1 transcriptional regulator, XRE family [Saccharophagus degradans 2-40]
MEQKVANIAGAKASSDARIEKMSEIHRFSHAELDSLKILYPSGANDLRLKVFRDLRTRVYASAPGKNFTCMVTSVVPDGGCTYVVNNLAAAIALDKTRTSLVVDCNFYAPSADSLIVTDTDVGLTDYLDSADMGVESIVYASGIPRVRVIPAGGNTEGATERLSSMRMHAFLDELKTRYSDRYILIDAPAVGEYAADTRIMASLCDFVLLVVPYGKVTEAQIRSAVDAIGEKRLVGMVFNHM